MGWVAGVDGCKAGWCVILFDSTSGERRTRLVTAFSELMALPEEPDVIAVDVPIGLPAFGGRACDSEARKLLRSRACCVFSAPARQALQARSYEEAKQLNQSVLNKSVSQQAWALFPKLREVDDSVSPKIQSLIYEIHPEVTFWALNDGSPINIKKSKSAGRSLRKDALERAGFDRTFLEQKPFSSGVAVDDFLDACAAQWTAFRIRCKTTRRLPEYRVLDDRGLDQAIWY